MFPGFENNDKDEDYLNEFRQKLNDQSMTNFEEKKNEINRSKNVFIGAVSGIAMAAVVGWFVLSPRYAQDPNAELPVIRRPQTAVKVQPTEPGGMEILNQDKTVYEIIEKKKQPQQVVENLLPPPEEPQLPVIAPQPEPEPEPLPLPPVVETPAVTTPEPIKVAETPKPAPVKEEIKEEKAVPLSEAAAKPEPVKEEKTNKAVNIVIPAKPAVEKETAAAPVKSAPAGSWVVQMMASNNKKATEGAWSGLVKKYNVLKGLSHEIETADLGSKGTFYRLHAGAFADRRDADRLCSDIKALGGTCLVKKK